MAFTEFVQKNTHLYELKNNIPLTVKGVANWTRYVRALTPQPSRVPAPSPVRPDVFADAAVLQ